MCVCVYERKRERAGLFVCMCVCVREREKERDAAKAKEYACVCKCSCLFVMMNALCNKVYNTKNRQNFNGLDGYIITNCTTTWHNLQLEKNIKIAGALKEHEHSH